MMGGGNTTSSELLPPLGAEPLGVETLPRAEQDAVPAGSVAWLESGLWCPAAHQRGSQVFPAPQEESSGVLGPKLKKTGVPIAAVFATARTRKQPRRPSADKWVKKLWDIHAV